MKVGRTSDMRSLNPAARGR